MEDRKMYLRFGAMILTSMVLMYAGMFASTWELDHLRFSRNRVFMTLTMGGTMGLVMLGWMLHMYTNMKANLIVVGVSIVALVGGVVLQQTQASVTDVPYMKAMIPHHSMAITTSERMGSSDVRVCRLAAQISEAQRREIREMDWLIDDIEKNGAASTAVEADSRPVPDFDDVANRTCP